MAGLANLPAMKRSRLGSLAALALAAFLAACASPQTDALLERPPPDLPSKAEVEEVPFYPQKEAYCGPATFAEMATWSGLPMTQDEAAELVYTPGREGTLQQDMIAAARRTGRLALPVDDLEHLLAELARGRPVLVFQNLALDWAPQWHYAVVVGYDLDRRLVVLRSGTERRHELALDTFERTWARADHWARLLLPPGELPVTGGRDAVIAEAAALERLDKPQAAAKAYQSVVERWPETALAWFGIGNARLALGEPNVAEAAYRKALDIAPDDPKFWNNLAYALHRQDRGDEAIAAAERAVRLAGADAAPYRETLRELGGRGPAPPKT